MPSSPHTGAGDRWMAGEPLPGVAFALHDEVEVADGRHAGRRGRVLLLVALPPDAAYLVALAGGPDVRVRQASLRAAP